MGVTAALARLVQSCCERTTRQSSAGQQVLGAAVVPGWAGSVGLVTGVDMSVLSDVS